MAHKPAKAGVLHAASVAGDLAEAKTTVNDESYRFQVGRFECLSLSDGSWDYLSRTYSPTYR